VVGETEVGEERDKTWGAGSDERVVVEDDDVVECSFLCKALEDVLGKWIAVSADSMAASFGNDDSSVVEQALLVLGAVEAED
jgi:hypothetical protein